MAEKKLINVTMFGEFSMEYDGKRIEEGLGDSQAWQLLKYLVANAGRVVTSAELQQELTFTGKTEDLSNTIRVRLRRSRQLLEALGLEHPKNGLLLYSQDCFWLNREYALHTDRQEIDRRFEALMDGGEPYDLSACVEALCAFSGQYLQNTKAYGWVGKMRTYYQKVYLHLWDRCISRMEETGDYAAAAKVRTNALKVMPRETGRHLALICGLLKHSHIAGAATYYSKLTMVLIGTGIEIPDFETLL